MPPGKPDTLLLNVILTRHLLGQWFGRLRIGSWAALLHFLDKVLDGPEFDQEEAACVNEIKGEINRWVFQTCCYSESDNHLEELASAVEEVSNLMKNIRKRIYVNPGSSITGSNV